MAATNIARHLHLESDGERLRRAPRMPSPTGLQALAMAGVKNWSASFVLHNFTCRLGKKVVARSGGEQTMYAKRLEKQLRTHLEVDDSGHKKESDHIVCTLFFRRYVRSCVSSGIVLLTRKKSAHETASPPCHEPPPGTPAHTTITHSKYHQDYQEDHESERSRTRWHNQ